jgi:hypothetical protein
MLGLNSWGLSSPEHESTEWRCKEGISIVKCEQYLLLGVPSMSTWVSIYRVVSACHYNAGNAPIQPLHLKTMVTGLLRSFDIYNDFHVRPTTTWHVSTSRTASSWESSDGLWPPRRPSDPLARSKLHRWAGLLLPAKQTKVWAVALLAKVRGTRWSFVGDPPMGSIPHPQHPSYRIMLLKHYWNMLMFWLIKIWSIMRIPMMIFYVSINLSFVPMPVMWYHSMNDKIWPAP